MTRVGYDISRTTPRRPLWRDLLLVAIPAAIALLALFFWTAESKAETLNDLRATHGLGPLRIDGQLSAIADGHARDMARASSGRCTMASLNHDGFQEHRGPAGAIAENVSCGPTNATAAIQQWMRSSGHRANILLRRAGSYGISSARSSTGVVYWSMELGP